jgi:SSS family solute:Na+ symporter
VNIGAIDYFILCVYLALVVGVGIVYSKDLKGLSGHFLAGKSSGWFLIGTSLFITTVSSEHVIGYSESGYSEGFAAGNFAWGSCLVVILLAWFFVPVLLRNNLLTMPEYIEKRFDAKSRLLISGLSIVVYIITKISITLFAGALLLEGLLGWDKYTSSLVLVLLTGILTIAGGFRGTLYTHVFHAYVFIFSALVVVVTCLIYIGGVNEMIMNVPKEHFHPFKANSDPNYPWLGMLLGAPILEVWYWCTDQFMMQRVLSGKDVASARRGALYSGFLMFLVPFLLLIPGFVAYMKFGPEVVAGETYLSVITEILPPGIKAIAVISLLSALISTLAATFNSTATLFTLDVYTRIYPKVGEFKIITMGKLATLVLVILGIVWVSFTGYFSENIIRHLQAVQSYIAPPFVAVFILGMVWKRATANSCFTVLIVGCIIGVFRVVLDLYQQSLNPDSILNYLYKVNFLYEAFYMFCFYIVLMILISLFGQKPDEAHVNNLVYGAGNNFSSEKSKEKTFDIYLSIFLAALLIGTWIILMFL